MHWMSSFCNILQMLNQFCWRNFSHRAWDWMKKKMWRESQMKNMNEIFLSWRHWCPIELRSCCIHAQNWRNTMKAYVHSLCFSHFLFRSSHTHRERQRDTHSVCLLIIPFGIVKRNQFVLYNPDSYANTFNYTQNSISLYVVYCFAIANNESEKKRNKNRRKEWAWCKYTKWSLNSCLRTYSIVYFAIHRCWENIQEAYFLRYF